MSKKIKAALIRKVREESGAPILRSKKVLEEFKGDEKKAVAKLKKEGHAKMVKRAGRATGQGVVAIYKHHTSKVGAMVELMCETDFVAKNEIFIKLGDELAMQVASMKPKDGDALLEMDYIKDPSKKISDLVNDVKSKTGENVQIGKIARFEVGG